MEIPIYSFTNIVDALVGVGNGKIAANRVREIKKAIPVDMTDIEKRFDPQKNSEILNQIRICREIKFLIDEIIENRNLEFFAKQELEKRRMELADYIRSKVGFNEFPEQAQKEIISLSKDELLQARLEKILALEKLIEELEKQNKILMAHYDEYVHNFAEEVRVELEKIEPYAKLPEKERIDFVNPPFLVPS